VPNRTEVSPEAERSEGFFVERKRVDSGRWSVVSEESEEEEIDEESPEEEVEEGDEAEVADLEKSVPDDSPPKAPPQWKAESA
jgi:hypothetical protein